MWNCYREGCINMSLFARKYLDTLVNGGKTSSSPVNPLVSPGSNAAQWQLWPKL